MNYMTSLNVATAINKLVAAHMLSQVANGLVIGNQASRSHQLAPTTDNVFAVRLNRQSSAEFIIPDLTKVLAVPDLLYVYAASAVSQIIREIDSDLYLAACSAFPAVGTGNMELAARLALADAAMKDSTVRRCVFVDNRKQLAGVPAFVHKDASMEVCAWAGSVYSLRVFESEAVPSAGPLLACNYRALSLVTGRLPQPLSQISEYAELGNFGMRVTMDYQPGTLTQRFTVDVLYTCVVMDKSGGVTIPLPRPTQDKWQVTWLEAMAWPDDPTGYRLFRMAGEVYDNEDKADAEMKSRNNDHRCCHAHKIHYQTKV